MDQCASGSSCRDTGKVDGLSNPDRPERPFIVGIGGGTGSGKTTLAAWIAEKYRSIGVALIDLDSYYLNRSHLPAEVRSGLNFDEPSAIDHDLLISHLDALRSWQAIEKPIYCFSTHTRSANTQPVSPVAIVIIEGLFALCDPRVRDRMDFKIYVDADSDLRFLRRLQRDISERGRTVADVIEQYRSSVRPMHLLHIEPSRAYADVVLESGTSLADTIQNAEWLIGSVLRRNVSVPGQEP